MDGGDSVVDGPEHESNDNHRASREWIAIMQSGDRIGGIGYDGIRIDVRYWNGERQAFTRSDRSTARPLEVKTGIDSRNKNANRS